MAACNLARMTGSPSLCVCLYHREKRYNQDRRAVREQQVEVRLRSPSAHVRSSRPPPLPSRFLPHQRSRTRRSMALWPRTSTVWMALIAQTQLGVPATGDRLRWNVINQKLRQAAPL
eukprot:GHVU01207179.1.p1 GENE.GHVU01207179.1~~GHVU01207179.1.p1  ORF type:complete len:117 (+),score=2.46 GHVU01207179.1:157-507(+)